MTFKLQNHFIRLGYLYLQYNLKVSIFFELIELTNTFQIMRICLECRLTQLCL